MRSDFINKIRYVQVRAGEQAVIDNLEKLGFNKPDRHPDEVQAVVKEEKEDFLDSMRCLVSGPVFHHNSPAYLQMYKSLLSAVDKAGGRVECFRTQHLDKMTVLELISHLASNHIRFIYIKPVK